jgi:hypothetical protein
MCYSKEVSLAVGGLIGTTCLASWWRQVRPLHEEQVGPGRAALRAFQGDVLRGLACVAGHQLFEFLAIATGDARVYKLGLLCSLTCMLFLARALERLTRSPTRIETGAVAAAILALAVHLAGLEMRFENCHFWVRGWSHTTWSVVWLTFFVYWNLRLREAARRTASAANARLLRRTGWSVLDASFLLSVAYVYGSAVAAELGKADPTWRALARTVLLGRDVYADAPSVWCVFAAVQCLLVPPFFAALRRGWEPEAPFVPADPPRVRRGAMLLASLLIVWGLCHLHPLVIVGAKMVTR